MSNKAKIDEFDIEDSVLPDAISRNALRSGGYPYDEKIGRKDYEKQLKPLHKELVKLQSFLQASGGRVAILFEGRDAAGKGGAIKTYLQYLNPRLNRIAALPRPSDRERGEWYFQRYVDYLPSRGEAALFDRSWYNRAVVEPVMGFCTPQETARFLGDAPQFEQMIVNDGIFLFKFWLNIGQEMQLKRFHSRHHNPLKQWKFSSMDKEAIKRWDDYTRARDTMLEATDTSYAPWTVIRANDKRRARLNLIRFVLGHLDYEGKSEERIGATDPEIALPARHFLSLRSD